MALQTLLTTKKALDGSLGGPASHRCSSRGGVELDAACTDLRGPCASNVPIWIFPPTSLRRGVLDAELCDLPYCSVSGP